MQHPAEDDPKATGRTKQLRARQLILAAGALGSTYLLLANRNRLPGLSSRLGHGFSGNGDLLTFALNARTGSGKPLRLDASHGPVITSTLRVPDARDGVGGRSRGFYLQDAGYPDFLDWLIQVAAIKSDLPPLVLFIWHRLLARLLGRGGSGLDRDLRALLADTRLSAGSLPLLGMGRDVSGGQFTLGDAAAPDRMRLDWSKDGSQPYFDEAVNVSRSIAKQLGAEFREDPLTQFFSRLITVHPLGGCAMGVDREHGVVSPRGQVFGHPGLYVADGAVMPGAVGPNPSWTIAALANLFATAMLGEE